MEAEHRRHSRSAFIKCSSRSSSKKTKPPVRGQRSPKGKYSTLFVPLDLQPPAGAASYLHKDNKNRNFKITSNCRRMFRVFAHCVVSSRRLQWTSCCRRSCRLLCTNQRSASTRAGGGRGANTTDRWEKTSGRLSLNRFKPKGSLLLLQLSHSLTFDFRKQPRKKIGRWKKDYYMIINVVSEDISNPDSESNVKRSQRLHCVTLYVSHWQKQNLASASVLAFHSWPIYPQNLLRMWSLLLCSV